MAFSFEDYLSTTEKKAQDTKENSSSVGYFKLEDGESALVRINYSSASEFMMTAYHQFDTTQNFMKVECLTASGHGKCPLCAAASVEHAVVSKAKTRIFVPMLAAFIDATTGQPKPAVPVIWDAQANSKCDWAKELAMKLNYFTDLRQHVFILKRTGTKFDTKYSLDYVPMYDKAEFVPMDFSAFEGFKIDRHSYWVKSEEEIQTYISTGAFPQAAKSETNTAAPIMSEPTLTPTPVVTPTPVAMPTPMPTPAVTPTPAAAAPQTFLPGVAPIAPTTQINTPPASMQFTF